MPVPVSSYKLPPLTVMCGCELRKKVSIAGANPPSNYAVRRGRSSDKSSLSVHP